MADSGPDGVATRSVRARAIAWLAAYDADEMLYGAVVAAAVLAVASDHASSVVVLLVSTTAALLVYWVAHVYTRVLANALADPARSWRSRIGASTVRELSVLRGGVPTLVIFAVASTFGADISTATDVAIWCTVLLLAGIGYLAAHAARAGFFGTVVSVMAAAGFGVLVAVLKANMH